MDATATTEFRDPRAVDIWDACFRLREGGELRDITIDATWQRVASALTTSTRSGEDWAARYVEAFSSWHVLPDERLLRLAGTQTPIASPETPAAVVNLARMVRRENLTLAIDHDALRAAARLAVRMLDDALPLFAAPCEAIRIGIIGTADALAGLGLDYDSDAARRTLAAVAEVLANGCLESSVMLARERGPRFAVDETMRRRWRARCVDTQLFAEAEREGVRFRELTAIDPHPMLAALANGVGDALDRRSDRTAGPASAPHDLSAATRTGTSLCAAMQPWIDASIRL